MKAQVATLNKLTINSHKGILTRYFTLETLEQLARSAIGKPITLGFNGMTLTTIQDAWLDEDDTVYISFDGSNIEHLNQNYIVPGFKTTTTKGERFQTVRCLDFALTNNPLDKTLKTIKELNNGSE